MTNITNNSQRVLKITYFTALLFGDLFIIGTFAQQNNMMQQVEFNYQDERFADLQLLRYKLNGFERLSLQQKKLIFYLSKATLFGRDITFDQFGKYNLRIRKMLEVVYTDLTIPHDTDEFRALEVYLKRIWWYPSSLWFGEV